MAGLIEMNHVFGDMNMKSKWLFSALALASPLLLMAFAFACRPIANERTQMDVFAGGAICFVLLALTGAVGAFVRKEGLRWFAVLPLLALLCLFGVGM